MIRRIPWLLVLMTGLSLSAQSQVLQTDSLPARSMADSLFLNNQPAAFRAQKYLVLDKPGRVKRLRFSVGSRITFRIKDDPTTYSDVITAVDDSSFSISGIRIPLREVDQVIVRKERGLLYHASDKLPKAGIMYFLLDNLNPVILGQDRLSVSKGSVIVSAALIGAGLLLRPFRTQTHRIGERKRLRVLEN